MIDLQTAYRSQIRSTQNLACRTESKIEKTRKQSRDATRKDEGIHCSRSDRINTQAQRAKLSSYRIIELHSSRRGFRENFLKLRWLLKFSFCLSLCWFCSKLKPLSTGENFLTQEAHLCAVI